MKAAVIREKTTQELQEQIVESRLAYDKLVMAHSISPLENPTELKKSRLDMARLKTELRAREIGNTQEN